MRHELSVTKAERAAIEAAEERGYAADVNDALARQMRAYFVAEEPAEALAAA